MVSRDDGLMRTCFYGSMRCCDGVVSHPDGVVRAGARKYFRGWGSKTSCQLKYNHQEKLGNQNWLKFLLRLLKFLFIISYIVEGVVNRSCVLMTGYWK